MPNTSPPADFTPWLDSWHLICVREPDGTLDGGDSMANAFTLAYCGEVSSISGTMRLFDNYILGQDGNPRRHPNAAKWYGRPGRCSRDQLIPALVWASKYSPQAFYWLLSCLWRTGFLFAWNTRRNFVYDSPEEHALLSTPDVPYEPAWKLPDLLGPNVHAILLRGLLRHEPWYIRCLIAVPVYCTLNVLDLQNLCASLLLYANLDSSNDQRNLALPVHLSAMLVPTPASLLSLWLLKAADVKKYFSLYWGAEGQPPIHKIVSRLF